MTLLAPELLLLALPLGWVLWRSSPVRSLRFALRALVGAALLLALARPYGAGAGEGRDLVLLVDRSRSMPAGSAADAQELVTLLAEGQQRGDRLAVLSFGAGVVLDRAPAPGGAFAGFVGAVDPDGSALADALDAALALVPEGRHGSILLLSDGEHHGEDPADAARRAALRGVRVDVRTAVRGTGADVAVEALELPESVAPGEPFQLSASVRAERATEATWRLLRGEEVVTRGRSALRRGSNRLLFRDVCVEPGLAEYRLLVEAEGDVLRENDRGLGALRVTGRRPLLLVNEGGSAGRLAAALRDAGLAVEVRAPEELPGGSSTWLEGFSGVVLENVAAAKVGGLLPDLAQQVADLGAGLLVTGGRASFGVGGYYRSPLEEVLPVTMEVRLEHRKMALAMAIVLDRSGSMAAAAGAGRTKMDLANAGAMEAIGLLGPIDEVAVIAVDSSAHVVVPLRPVDDPMDIAGRVSGIESMGGGIYTYTGLLEAAHQLEDARAANRHVILFADAADAEEPEGCAELLATLTEERGTTVSVVALGSAGDVDAAFLREVAQRGGGQAYFTSSADELPELFAQDTLLAARSSFVDVPTGCVATPAAQAFSTSLGSGPWATLAGYNLAYLRPGAAAGVITTDEYAAPIVATMQAGLGRSAAFCGQVDGAYGVSDGSWPVVAGTLVTLARWIAGQDPPEGHFASVRREGGEAVIEVEVERGAGSAAGTEPLLAHLVRPDGGTRVVPLVPTAGDSFVGRVPLGGEGIWRLAVRTSSGEALPVAPLAVSYSPEFEPRASDDEGSATLARLARLGQGRVNPPLHEVLAGERGGRATQPLGRLFVALALVLMLGEILWRRVFEGTGARRARSRAAPAAEVRRSERSGADLPGADASGADGGDLAIPVIRPRDTHAGVPSPDQTATRPGVERPTLDDVLSDVKRRGRRR